MRVTYCNSTSTPSCYHILNRTTRITTGVTVYFSKHIEPGGVGNSAFSARASARGYGKHCFLFNRNGSFGFGSSYFAIRKSIHFEAKNCQKLSKFLSYLFKKFFIVYRLLKFTRGIRCIFVFGPIAFSKFGGTLCVCADYRLTWYWVEPHIR